jgi:hypothetical protein
MTNITYPPSCDCQECIDMCRHRPCWGSPRQMLKIMYTYPEVISNLMIDYWVGNFHNTDEDTFIISPAIVGYESGNAPSYPCGRCTFLTDENKCKIHDVKPFEGKIAHHSQKSSMKQHELCARSWDTKKGYKVVEMFKQMRGHHYG